MQPGNGVMPLCLQSLLFGNGWLKYAVDWLCVDCFSLGIGGRNVLLVVMREVANYRDSNHFFR
jgi:hypothetical protein